MHPPSRTMPALSAQLRARSAIGSGVRRVASLAMRSERSYATLRPRRHRLVLELQYILLAPLMLY